MSHLLEIEVDLDGRDDADFLESKVVRLHLNRPPSKCLGGSEEARMIHGKIETRESDLLLLDTVDAEARVAFLEEENEALEESNAELRQRNKALKDEVGRLREWKDMPKYQKVAVAMSRSDPMVTAEALADEVGCSIRLINEVRRACKEGHAEALATGEITLKDVHVLRANEPEQEAGPEPDGGVE